MSTKPWGVTGWNLWLLLWKEFSKLLRKKKKKKCFSTFYNFMRVCWKVLDPTKKPLLKISWCLERFSRASQAENFSVYSNFTSTSKWDKLSVMDTNISLALAMPGGTVFMTIGDFEWIMQRKDHLFEILKRPETKKYIGWCWFIDMEMRKL